MTKKMKDPNEPVGRMFRVKDYLPPPEKLVLPEETIKVTISLKKSSVAFFKDQAGRYHTKYQKMIRELVDKYARQYSAE